METACDGSLLLVGDGDFSFTLSLLKHGALSPAQVTTSNLETAETIQQHKLASSNMSELESLGACVLLEVDAREVHTHSTISQKLYSRIIFNFPLADRHNIKKNRALLADFFSSCSQVLAPAGQVMVTLCKGQGGTPADQPQRSWHDSWQALAMAANAGFILADILPFEAARFPEYHSVGFRFQDKSFDTEGSLIHVFEKADMVCVAESIVARGSVELGGSMYSCSQYIAEKLKRNLLEEDNSPVRWLKAELEHTLGQCFSSISLPCGNSEAALPGHKSYISVKPNIDKPHTSEGFNTQQIGTELKANVGDGDALTEIKRQKDEDNLSRKKELASSLFAHGVDGVGDVRSHASYCSESFLNQLIPENNESVYVLIKSYPRAEIAGDEEITGSEASNDTPMDSHTNGVLPGTKGSDQHIASCDKVFHHRTSLLENLTLVCCPFDDASAKDTAGKAYNSLYPREMAELNIAHSVTVTGRCCSPQPIQPHALSVHHELMFVHKLSHSCEAFLSSTDSSQSAQFGNNDLEFESISSRLLSCLQNSIVFKNHSEVEICPGQCSHKLELGGMVELKVVKDIYRKDRRTENASQHIGIILKAITQKSNQFLVLLLHLDSIICHIRGIPDPRLLWSHNPQVISQLKKFASLGMNVSSETPVSLEGSFPASHDQFQAVSLYRMKFVHDLSFWENSNSDEPFDESELLEVIRYTAQDSVVKISLLDKYQEPESGRTSRCYRLHFQSHCMAFPYAVSWKLQSLIRIEVARRLGVVLR